MVKSFVRSVGMMAAVVASCVAFVGSNAFGSVVTGDSQNNAITFDPATPTPVEVNFFDSKIATDRYIQVGFRTDATVFNIGSIEYSYDNSTFTSLTASFGAVGAQPTYNYSSVIDLGAGQPGAGNTTVYFKYTIPAGVGYEKLIQFVFKGNNNNYQVGGVLSQQFGNDFSDLTRDHTSIAAPSVPEPTSFAIASIGLGLAGVARMRKRAKKSA